MATDPIHMWAHVGAARAKRAGRRSVARSGAGKRARRSGAEPGLDEVEKPVTALGAHRLNASPKCRADGLFGVRSQPGAGHTGANLPDF